MCGIFGISTVEEAMRFQSNVLLDLGINSESRGKDASGISFSGSHHVFKSDSHFSSRFTRNFIFNELRQSFTLCNSEGEYVSVIGHTRLATNGTTEVESNNQPVVLDEIIGIHNGIICNLEELNSIYSGVRLISDLDSELLFRCIVDEYKRTQEDLPDLNRWLTALNIVFPLLEGAASIAFLTKKNQLFLATNTGSLFVNCDGKNLIFSSEKIFLLDTLKNFDYLDPSNIQEIKANTALGVELNESGEIELKTFDLNKRNRKVYDREKRELSFYLPSSFSQYVNSDAHKRRLFEVQERISNLIRCSICLLPSSHPFISFNAKGVCSYCENYKRIEHLPERSLFEKVESLKENRLQKNCIVPLSGGRDSVYVLHVVKEILGLQPIAYTYDWGLVTDLARRNQSRVTQALSVEHIVVSADIRKKRNNVRKNVTAWLKTPDLGIIPLFMAGDKMFFTHANELRKKLQIDTVFFGMNEFENNDFKEGFCNVNKLKFADGSRFYHMGLNQQIAMISHYGKQFIRNPKYLNESLMDTLKAYSAYYIADHDYTLLYKYFPWNEKEIEETIIKNYNFELSPDTESSWRIGDGTASFYNYIYYSLAGFSESEPMRSNQIREGQITREEGLLLSKRDNKPRYESFSWYCETIGLDPVSVMKRIDEMPFVENKWK